MEKKKLVINCVACDMRNMKKELLDTYESITVNAAAIFTNSKVQLMTAPYDVQLNCADVIALEEDVEIITQNGLYHIKKGDRIPERKFYLSVNGKVIIENDTEEILKQCVGISINGKLVCPNSMLAALPHMQINGKTESYPDGAVVVSGVFCPDKVFVLRARKADYFASSKVVLADEGLDVQAIVAKGAHFITPKALIAESLLEDAISLFDDEAKIEVLEQGMNYVDDDTELDLNIIRKYGKKLYVDGDVRIEDADVLEQIEALHVNGTLRVKEALEDAVLQKGDVLQYEKLIVERGTWIANKVSLRVDAKLFERNPGEIHISDVAKVTILPEVTEEQIAERLKLSDCALVSCSPKQRSVVELVSEDVAKISSSQDEEDGLLGMLKELKGTKVINTSNYTF